jgi:hypothetical protein
MQRVRPRLAGRILFWLTLGVAGLLVALVAFAPVLADGEALEGWDRVVFLFARDTTLRRVGLACATGLVVTAFVFFRGRSRGRPGASVRYEPQRPRSVGGAGA